MQIVKLIYRWNKITISDNEQFDKETKIKTFPEVLVLQLGVITEVTLLDYLYSFIIVK